jgi:hypothetical protein
MRNYAGVLALALVPLGIGAMVVAAQDRVPDPVAWVYGFVNSGPNPVAPPCAADTKPHDCSWPGRSRDAVPVIRCGNYTISGKVLAKAS